MTAYRIRNIFLFLVAFGVLSCSTNRTLMIRPAKVPRTEVIKAFRPPELVRVTRNQVATFQIDDRTKGGHGSAIVISKEGHLITAYHVVKDNHEMKILVAKPDNTIKSYDVKVIAVDKKHDLAIIKIDYKFSQPAVLEDPVNINPGDEIYNIGYPHDIGIYVGRGSIGKVGWTKKEFGMWKTDYHDVILADIKNSPGTSGSGVFSAYNGKLAGIITNWLYYPIKNKKVPVYTLFHVIQSVRYVKELLDREKVPYLTGFESENK